MKPKINMKKLIRDIKNGAFKEPNKPAPRPLRIDIDYTKPLVRGRDMRQDALDMGAHGSKEIWGSKDAGTV